MIFTGKGTNIIRADGWDELQADFVNAAVAVFEKAEARFGKDYGMAVVGYAFSSATRAYRDGDMKDIYNREKLNGKIKSDRYEKAEASGGKSSMAETADAARDDE